jgi:hypothetical protein
MDFIVYPNGLSLSCLAWAFNMTPTQHTVTGIWHAMPIVGVF